MNPKNATRRALSLLHARRPRTNRPAAHNGSTTTKRKGSGRFTKRVGVLAIIVLAAMSFGVYVVLAANQFWNTNGVSNTWTAANWGTTAAGPFTNGWTANNDANFTANSLITYVTNTAVGNINVTNGSTVTMTAAGTYNTNGAVRTLDVGTGSILDFAAQSISSAAGTGFIKNGNGIFFSSNGNAYTGGFTLNAGTIIIGGVNAMGNGGPLTINGGTFAANATRNITARYSSVTIGGDFTIGAVTTGVPSGNGTNAANITFGDNMSLGAATRTITIGSNANYTLGGIISGSAGSGLTVANASGATGTLTLNGANTYTGDTTISSGKLSLGTTGSIANSTNIILAGGSTFDVSTRGGVTLASGQGLKGSGTTTTGTIATAASNGLTTAANSPLQFTAFNGTTAPLTIGGAGTVTLASGNPVTVTVANGGTPLGAGTYTLISKGASGTVAGTAPTSLTVNGDGLASGAIASLQITGSQLVMNVLSTTGKYRSRQSGNWSDFNTWQTDTGGGFVNAVSGQTPTSAADTIQIQSPHTVTVTASVDADQLTVDSGGTLSVNNGVTFTIADGTGTDLTDNGIVATAGNITNNGQAIINDTLQINQGGFPGGGTGTYAYNQTTGVLVFNNTSGSFGVNNVNFWPTTNGPQNVNVKGLGGGITMNVARTVGLLFQYAAGVSNMGNLTLNGTSQVNPGGFTSGSPTYGAASLLKYNTGGTYGRNGEWLPGATIGAGYPNNVQLSNNTTLDLPNSSTASPFQMAGTLTIDSGSTMQMAGATPLTQPLNVLGSVIINGTLALSTSPGGDFKLGGNWTRSGTFTPNGRAVTFNGTTTQTITVSPAGSETFNYLIVDKSAGNLLLSNSPATSVLVNATVGDVFQLLNASVLDLNGQSMAMQNNGGNILTSGGVHTISGSGGTFTFTGSKTVTGTGGGTLVFAGATNVILNAAVNFGATLTTIQGTLTMSSGGSVNTNPPTYANTSTLVYDCTCVYARGTEWSATSGPGYPNNVTVNTSTDVNIGSTTPNVARQIAGSLDAKSGGNFLMDHPSLPMTAALTVLKNVLIETGGGLHLSTASGGDLHLQGDFTNNGNFVPNNRAVFFEGGVTQTVLDASGTATMPYVRINKSGSTVQLNSNLTTLGPTGGDSIQFTGATSTLTLNSRTLTLGSTIGTPPAGSGLVGDVNATLSLQNGGATGPMGTFAFVSGGELLNSLTINRTGANASATLGSNLTVNNALNLTSGDILTGANIITMPPNATSTGVGDVVGNVKRTGFVNGAHATNSKTFGNPNVQISFQTGTPATDVTVNLVKSRPTGNGFGFPAAVDRTYTITQNGASAFTATLRLHYLTSEVNGNTEALLDLWRFNGTSWNRVTKTSADVLNEPNKWVESSLVTQFSPWTLAQGAALTKAKLVEFKATQYDVGTALEWRTGSEVDNLGFNLYREVAGRRRLVNSSLIAGSALVAGQSVTMTAGNSYSWVDGASSTNARYWLEEIDLMGKTTTYGPFVATRTAGRGWAKGGATRSPLISQLSNGSSGSPQDGQHQWTASDAARTKMTRALNSLAANSARDKQRQLASRPAVKLSVRASGWYRVTREQLVAAGLNASADPTRLQMFVGGVEVPISVDAATWTQPGGAVEFYGEGLDVTSTDTQVYWLVEGDTQGLRTNAAPTAAAPSNGGDDTGGPDGLNTLPGITIIPPAGGPDHFNYTVERRDRSIYFSSLQNGDAENFFGRVVNANAVTQTLSARNLYPLDAPTTTLEVALQGLTAGSHHVSVIFNGTELGTLDFDGPVNKSATFVVESPLLRDGDNDVRMVSSGSGDVSLTDHLRLTYPHKLRADDDRLRFNAPSGTVNVGGFSSPYIRVVDVTDPASPVELSITQDAIPDPQGGWSVAFNVSGGGGNSNRELFAFTDSQVVQPASITSNKPSTWSTDVGQRADMVVITHGDFTQQVAPLVAQRAAEGLDVKVLDIEDLYDEFSYGAHSPQAVRDFLAWTKTNWEKAPAYVLLVGDGTYDPRDHLGRGRFDLVPSKLIDAGAMETASDDWFADFDDDGIADVAVGRLPVRTQSEAATVINKIVGRTPQGAEQPTALLVADRDGPDGYSFETATDGLQTLMPSGTNVSRVNRRAQDGATVHGQIVAGVNAGPLLVNWMGHGSIDVWTGDGLLRGSDASTLTNGTRLPLFVMMTCLNGYYEGTGLDSLAESMIKAEGGGAYAVWASSGMTEPVAQTDANRELYRIIFTEGSAVRLGDAVRRAKAATADRDVRRTWVFFGDPSSRLR